MSEGIPPVSPELPSLAWRAALAALKRLPQAALSRGFGALADTPLPRAVRPAVLGAFAKAMHIDVSEAELPFGEYGSLNAFFVRRLRAGARSWPEHSLVAASPVDAVVGQMGAIVDGTLLQAKGRSYTASAFLQDEAEAARFQQGSFLTLYLSPRHYHRIHAPIAGAIDKARHVPGGLLPVNEPSVMHIAELFARNERLICYLQSGLGRVAVVAVGAYNVGRISAAFDDWLTNQRGASAETRTYQPPKPVAAGDEIMAFHLGSTVVLLLEHGVRLNPALRTGSEIRLGQPITSA